MCTFWHKAFNFLSKKKLRWNFLKNKKKQRNISGRLSSFCNSFCKKKSLFWSGILLCYHTDESVIPQMSQYYCYSRGIIGVIVHSHVINIDYIMAGFVYDFYPWVRMWYLPRVSAANEWGCDICHKWAQRTSDRYHIWTNG